MFDIRHLRLALAATILVALAGTIGLAASARAETYEVGTAEDIATICEVPSSNTCSLRGLINYENNLPSTPNPPDKIVVPANEGSTFYFLSNGPLTIFRSVVIAGAGASKVSIFQNSTPVNRVFVVEPNPRTNVVPTVTISGLSMVFGHANANNGYFGGDILNRAILTLSEDAIIDGTAEEGSGGGVANEGGTLTVTHSLISNNQSTNPNGAGGDSGGIQNFGPNPVTGTAGKLVVEDSTVTRNSAALGGGIFSWCGGTEGACSTEGEEPNTTTIVNSTIANNNGGSRSTEGGGLLASQGTISVQNSIVAGNTVNLPATETPSNCGNSGISSLGHNLESAADCGFTATGDLQNTDPQFMSSGLQDNGGNTETLALQANSPAIDAVPANAPGCGGTDQRSVSRPQGVGCDIGAYELFQPVEGQPFSEVVGAASPQEGSTPTVDWGDGTNPSPATFDPTTGHLTGTHTYAEEGIYHGSFSYLNSDGGLTTRPFDLKVQDAPLSATGVPLDATAGVQSSPTVATFADGDPAGTVSDYTARINWGDGSNSAGTIAPAPSGGFAVSGTHTYANVGTYATTVTIADVGGADAVATSSANVTPLPPPPPPLNPAAPALIGTAPPSVLTTTSAVFTATVNPNGLPTTVHFEYGGTFGGATVAAITYGTSTPNQSVPPDFASHTVTATVTGLLPNVTYHVRAVASNSLGTAQGADQILQTPADPPPPPPVLGKTANIAPVSGIVYIELPPGATLASFARAPSPTEAFAALTKGRSFIPLTEARQIPFGSILEASKGVAKITTATTASPKGKVQFGNFGAGIFKLLQARKQHGLTELSVINNHSARQVCASTGKGKKAALASHASSKVLGRLSANSHGHFTGRGQYSAATVRGTTWSVQNRCDGTLTHVVRGTLSVRDFHKRKTVTLFTGQSYLARAPGKRG
ncbi:MAG TPA: choice-of-anchor Q domain-containing protein [Solirubrobacteraceae bacterium]